MVINFGKLRYRTPQGNYMNTEINHLYLSFYYIFCSIFLYYVMFICFEYNIKKTCVVKALHNQTQYL